ncbi:MAG TPA: helix-turn-helix domain-containing protein, partial [Flavobacterium sp.]|nr:helix-turn-helix domain-containing protein [Flavobacterium sp.]
EKVDITPANLSILKTGKAKAIRFSTLEAICKILGNFCLNKWHRKSNSYNQQKQD